MAASPLEKERVNSRFSGKVEEEKEKTNTEESNYRGSEGEVKNEGKENGEEERRVKDEDLNERNGDGAGANEADLELFSCMLQPPSTDSDPEYIGMRRLLLYRKAAAGLTRRKDWRCSGRGYVAFRNYINRPRNWESMLSQSVTSTPNQSGQWNTSLAPFSLTSEVGSWTSSRDLRGSNQARTSFSSSTSDNDRLHRSTKKTEPAYSFVGMHCIFDQSKASVTVLKFGHMRSDLLAYGAADGSLTVCSVSDPPKVQKILTGHSRDCTDFDFTSNNLYIASCSLDKTVRIWDIAKGICVRVIYGVSSQWCIRFHPVNNNLLFAGNAKKEINVYNFSTGRLMNKIVLEDEVTAMDNDHTGHLIFCGDAKGCIYTLKTDSQMGALSRTHRNKHHGTKCKSPITIVKYRTFSLLARGPVLLACSQDGSLSFFSVALEVYGYLTLRCSLKLTPRVHRIHASFCPLLSLEKGEYIVAGSEDSNVYFYDLTRPRHTCVNKLQGHSSPVIGIAWNHGENLLASSDSEGTVIVWKRAKTAPKS